MRYTLKIAGQGMVQSDSAIEIVREWAAYGYPSDAVVSIGGGEWVPATELSAAAIDEAFSVFA